MVAEAVRDITDDVIGQNEMECHTCIIFHQFYCILRMNVVHFYSEYELI